MTMLQFLNRLQKVAPQYSWSLGERIRGRAPGTAFHCPIEIVFNGVSAFSCKQLTGRQINEIVNAADNGTWLPSKPFQSLRSKLKKAIGVA